jgi:hypothetical protein
MIERVDAMAVVAAAAAPLVNWSGLLRVLALAVGTAVVIVGGFSLGLVALDVYVSSLRQRQPALGGEAVADEALADASPAVRHASLVAAVLLFLVCIAAVAAGLVEMVHR